ncbi:cytochrome c oxidase subunit II [Geoalkalibacter sp.]|uniref:cytochrome c oxidase subunit II n=1 Tax=Geoalkalibacter sp. TaxID=3041440 RepID=UPI00272DFD62|nr:cytochrome c oxidase subunit II [Geoalkalibacter sp.]
MTPQIQTTTEAVDQVFLLIFGISVVMLLGIAAVMVYFAVRYHHRRHPQPTSQVSSNLWLEITWTVLPTLIVLAMFYYGWAGYLALRNVPEGAMEVKAVARMWSWVFEYENGRASDRLYVPVGRPVKVHLVSEDVLHSFYVPAFRIKRDMVPGMDNYVWFVAPEAGSYHVFCAEYCGTGHADMITRVEALPEGEFIAWLARVEDEGAGGEDLLRRHGCLGCHSLDGAQMAGPTFKGLYGREKRVLSEGRERTLIVDAEYLRRSILQPKADVVVGYPPIMPDYEGRLSEEDLEAMVEFLRTLQ